MHYLNYFLTTLFIPFSFIAISLPDWVAITLISLLTSVLALFVYKKVSDPLKIKTAKSMVKAGILEMLLFKDNPAQTVKSLKFVLSANLKYFLANLKPVAYLIIPAIVLIIQVEPHLAHRPFKKNETFLFSLRGINKPDVEFKGLIKETDPFFLEEENRYYWRLKYNSDKDAIIKLSDKTREIKVKGSKNSFLFSGSSKSLSGILSPVPYNALDGIQAYEIKYPEREIEFLSVKTYWLYPYFLLTILFAFILKGFFKVEL
ncbi:MAG: hypothetical protein JXA60_02285 [Candidatus Coatesbacteria bacterium]|nr:hypothetical protein [Candidatus Coatesbacteria bacterium]